ncbi:MAG: hypothetical protein RSF30_09945 [Lachnospiraceae bacterium]
MNIMNFTDACRMFGDLWQLYKIYAGQQLTENEMETFVDETRRLHDKYNRSKFCLDMILAIVGEVERTDKHFRKE